MLSSLEQAGLMMVAQKGGNMTPVSEFGEIGCVIEHTKYDGTDGKQHGLVIVWRVRKVGVAKADSEIEGWKAGDRIYWTSRGWIHVPDEAVFMPMPRERSLRPCSIRALKYAQTKYPGCKVETH